MSNKVTKRKKKSRKKAKLKSSMKGRQKDRRVKVEATAQNLTSQAGLVAAANFLRGHNFDSMIKECIEVSRGNNAVYQFSDMIEYSVLGIIAGARSLDKVGEVWKDDALRKMLSWASVPDRTTIGRLMASLNMDSVIGMEQLVHLLRRKIWEAFFLPQRDSDEAIIIDIDSTVKTSYGNQEGAEKGYNPVKKGANSFNPQLAFCAETKEILQACYRCGSAYTLNGVVEFVSQMLAQLPTSHNYYFRADSGYFSGHFLDYLEEEKQEYLIKVKLKNLPNLLESQEWKDVEGELLTQETIFKHQCKGWSKERTFKAVRIEIPVKEDPGQDTLIDVKGYAYFCYVTTDLHLSSWKVHKKYGKRATCETWIEEGKNQVALGQIKMNSFEGSSILFQSSVIAYNVFRYMGLCSGVEQLMQWEPSTIRTYLIRTAGKLITGSNQLKLLTPIHHFHQVEWDAWLRIGGLMKAG